MNSLHTVAPLPPPAAVPVWRGPGGLAAAAAGSLAAENHKQLLWENQPPVYQEIGAEHQVRPAGRRTGTAGPCSSMTWLQTLRCRREQKLSVYTFGSKPVEKVESVDVQLSECFISCPSLEHTVGSDCGGTCTINTLPCRDFTLTRTESRQSGRISLLLFCFGGSACSPLVQSILQFKQEIHWFVK